MLGKCHAKTRYNYNMPSILHLSFYLPNLLSLSFPFCDISSSDHCQVLSRLPSQLPKYKPRDPASVGCLRACLLSLYQAEKPYQAERSPTVGEDDAQTDIDKYLSATQTHASPQLRVSRKPWAYYIVVEKDIHAKS